MMEVPYSRFNFVFLRTPSVHYCSHKSLSFAPYSEPDEFTSLVNTLFFQDPLPIYIRVLKVEFTFHVFRMQIKFSATQEVLTHYYTVCIAARYSNFKLSGPINFTLTLHQMGSPLVVPSRLTTIPINSLRARRSVRDVTVGVNQDVWVDYV